jgi:hypothetical protein
MSIPARLIKGGVLIFFPGLYGGLYGQNLPYKFKKPYGDFQNRNFEKSHRTTGPRSDLRPDSWSWANSGLDTTSRIFENGIFWVTTSAGRIKQRHGTHRTVRLLCKTWVPLLYFVIILQIRYHSEYGRPYAYPDLMYLFIWHSRHLKHQDTPGLMYWVAYLFHRYICSLLRCSQCNNRYTTH